MNNCRLCVTSCFLFLIAHVISSNVCDKYSIEDNIPLKTKVRESAIIVLGTSIKKHPDANIRNLFNITFLVSCILKGRPTQRIINIVQAGLLLGRRSCQKLNINQKYVVFLEPFFDGTYRPADFEEIPYNSKTNALLENTCGLSRTFPFTEVNDTNAVLTNKCPPAASILCQPETSRSTTESSTLATSVTTETIHSSVSTTMTAIKSSFDLIGKDPIDLAVISLLLAEHQNNSLSLDFLREQHHKSLGSDDEMRKNGIHRLTSTYINFLCLIFLKTFYIMF